MSTVAELVRECPVLTLDESISRAAEVMLDSSCDSFLSLPVLDEGRPVGVVTRHSLQQIYLSRFGRDLHARKPVGEFMRRAPILVDAAMPVEEASPRITTRIGFPIREDFIVTREGIYTGVGVVVDLLKAMEQRVARRNEEIASAYRQLKESQMHLVQSEKMASLGQMVAGVAHELNTPLGYVRNNLELITSLAAAMRDMADTNRDFLRLLDTPDADPEVIAGFVARLRDEAERGEAAILLGDLGQLLEDTLFGCSQISELVSSLKDFSRLDRAASEDVDINECVTAALLIARNVLKDKAEVVRDNGVLPPLPCVPSQINQVLLNMLTNAAHAIEGRGRILVKTRHDKGCVTISIQDNGRGMPREVVEKIFDPFFTTKPVGQGTGLGLPICYRIIQDHGGTIRVASEPGKGTRFLITLPLSRSGATLSPGSTT
jgi:signal transduction histidine kinase